MEISVREQPTKGMDPCVYKAAISPGQNIDSSKLEAALNRVTPNGMGNTLLHLAAKVGNLDFIKKILKLNPVFLKDTNGQGNTALHLAAQGGFLAVVSILMKPPAEIAVNALNKLHQTALFKACESGHLPTVKALYEADPSSLSQKTVDEQTCLHVAVINGNSVLTKNLLERPESRALIRIQNKHGDTVLHLAVGRKDRQMIGHLLEFDPELCYCLNENRETPLCVAAKLGFLEGVIELINCRPDSVEIPNRDGMNVLHLVAHVSQVLIVDYLNKMVDLSELVNQRVEQPLENEEQQETVNFHAEGNDLPPKIENHTGSTPLHIAVRNKSFYMVESLLRIRGVNKDAINKEGLTALDIARENTEYHESYRIIAKLANHPPKCRPFLYSAPTASPQKQKNAIEIVDRTFENRRNSDLVVAVLIATMSFTAVFTVPGGFQTEKEKKDDMLGWPILIGFDSFKVFLIFDCVAFFMSLFVVLMWEMSTSLTTRDKMFFMCLANVLVSTSFAFTAYGFMLAVYTVLAYKTPLMAWLVLGFCVLICLCANFAFFYLAAKFVVKRARFHRLCGVPRRFDNMVQGVWMKFERYGILDILRCCDSKLRQIIAGRSVVREALAKLCCVKACCSSHAPDKERRSKV